MKMPFFKRINCTFFHQQSDENRRLAQSKSLSVSGLVLTNNHQVTVTFQLWNLQFNHRITVIARR